MKHTIILTDEEETFLNSILETKFKTNGVVPTIDEVLTTQIKNKIASLKKETEPYTYAEKVKSRWNSLPDVTKKQIMEAVDTSLDTATEIQDATAKETKTVTSALKQK